MPEKPEKTEKPLQQQTISLRISEALRSRLERAKEILSSKTGESVFDFRRSPNKSWRPLAGIASRLQS